MPKSARASAKVTYLKPKKQAKRLRVAKSYESVRQREIAWMLYITEGHIANLSHALAINCVTFKPSDTVFIQKIIRDLESQAQKFRSLMHDLSEK